MADSPPAPVPLATPEPPAPGPRPLVDEEAVELARQLKIEITKSLLANALAANRGSMQLLQALTGALLTSYTTLLIAFGKQVGIDRLPVVVIVLPVLCYTLSLVAGFIGAALYRGSPLVLGDLSSGVRAYEAVVAAHRRQLILPLALMIVGLVVTTAEAVYLFIV